MKIIVRQIYIKIFFIILLLSILSSCSFTKSNNKSDINKSSEIISGNSGNVNSNNSEDNVSKSTSKKHNVTFKDYDGKILKTESVADGKSATPPDNASKEGYKIAEWDKSFDNVKEDLVVTPVYEKISGPTISIGNITAKAGETVKVPVGIHNNPGINGISVKIAFNENLTLKKAKNDKALDGLNFTESGELTNPSTFLWDGLDENIKGNGEMLVLTFKVSDNVKPGEKLGISVSYTDGAIYDKDLNDVKFDVVGGSITIE